MDDKQNVSNTKADVEASKKKNGFDRELRQLIKQSEETIHSRYGALIELGELRPELVCLNKYSNIYSGMKPEEHYCYFETFYNKNRMSIINSLEDDKWLRSGNLYVQFGEGIKDLAEKCKSIRIMLSDIYAISWDLKETAEKSLDGIDQKFASGAGSKDLIRPQIFLLHLMRIFYYLNDGSDKIKLGEIITKLEEELGIPKERMTVVKESATEDDEEGGLSSIFNVATGMMKKMGIEPPPDIKKPSNKEISTIIDKIFNNDATQGALEKMFSSLQGCTDLGSCLQTVVKNVTDPSTMSAIQDSVMQTSQIASQLPQAGGDNSSDNSQ